MRDLEHRLQTSRGWENKPKPVVKEAEPVDPTSPAQYMEKVKLMYQSGDINLPALELLINQEMNRYAKELSLAF